MTLANKHRQERLERKRYGLLIATPDVLTGGISPIESGALTLPFHGNLAISYSVAVTAADIAVNTSTGRVLELPPLDADEIHRLGFFERGVDITIDTLISIAGVATIYYLDQWRNPHAIATSTFT